MKLDQLTFTRFLAAVAIVVYHAESAIFPFNLPFLHTIFSHANAGVSYFFILSGFVMIIAYGRNNAKKINASQYYLNRVARLYPIYLIALLLMVTLHIRYGDLHIRSLILTVFAIQSWFPSAAMDVNFPAWSISVEVLFYAVFPFLFNYVYRKYPNKWLYVAVGCFWVATQLLVNYLYFSPFYHGFRTDSHNLLFYHPLLHINEFLVGNMVGIIFLRIHHKAKNFDGLVILSIIIMVILLSLNTIIDYHDGLMAIIFAPFILIMSLNTGKISSWLSNKYLMILGEASYGIYILQTPIKAYSNFITKNMHLTDTGNFYFYLVVLIIVSLVCYYFVEIPLRNRIRRL